jgi:hypothetical protein
MKFPTFQALRFHRKARDSGQGVSLQVLISIGLLLLISSSVAQTNEGAVAGALKQLSLEALLDIEVTSVSKRPEKLSETASAIRSA